MSERDTDWRRDLVECARELAAARGREVTLIAERQRAAENGMELAQKLLDAQAEHAAALREAEAKTQMLRLMLKDTMREIAELRVALGLRPDWLRSSGSVAAALRGEAGKEENRHDR